ncbi:MAG: Lrp/AsnC ligand binding domain-containing protein [Bacteroidales bacterium]|nr:Lrp/AsnC ligand binding domain-containing protein [Bacteroidales bacterium]
MANHFHLDSLDKRILTILLKNARIPFLEVARKCGVSGAAIHQRVQKMIEEKAILGSQYIINPTGIGFNTCAFVGVQVNLTTETTHQEVFQKIKEIPEIVECHHITGKHSLLLKIYTRNNEHLKRILVEKIQSIREITSTETLISLEEGFTRQLPVENI